MLKNKQTQKWQRCIAALGFLVKPYHQVPFQVLFQEANLEDQESEKLIILRTKAWPEFLLISFILIWNVPQAEVYSAK